MTFRIANSLYERHVFRFFAAWTALFFLGMLATPAVSQDSQLAKAIGITPKQDVDFERPDAEQLEEYVFERTQNPSGFVVHHESGRVLRRFLDNNGDGKLDQWSYFKDGAEVYREIDANFDGKLDEYRWVGTTGSRWGLDKNQDGSIDRWKVISPEEVAFECFQAIKQKDAERFSRLLLSPAEFQNLELGPKIGKEVQRRLTSAQARFMAMVGSQKSIGATSSWIYAGNGQPSMMPADGLNKRDLMIYENASGFFEGGSSTQLALGSLVKVGDAWRMIELPEIVDPAKPFGNGGAFFPLADFGGPEAVDVVENAKLAKLYDQLASVEKELETAKDRNIGKLEKNKADILVQFILATKNEKTKRDWIENLADSVASAYQSNRFKGGIDYLNKFIRQNKNTEGVDYVKWSSLFAAYGWANSNGSKKQREKAYKQLIDELKAFQEQFPQSEFAADALIQIAVHYEVTANDEPDKAIQWYQQCQKRFGDTQYGRRAAGAITRLSSFGKSFPLSGKTANGKDFHLRSLRGKMVVLHFWETWCFGEDDVKQLAKLAEKYKDDLVVVGCNVERGSLVDGESDATDLFRKFLKNNPNVTWPQLHAPGGVDDSPLAHQLGIATEPLIVLIDSQGKLVETNIGLGNLEREIERERRRKN